MLVICFFRRIKQSGRLKIDQSSAMAELLNITIDVVKITDLVIVPTFLDLLLL